MDCMSRSAAHVCRVSRRPNTQLNACPHRGVGTPMLKRELAAEPNLTLRRDVNLAGPRGALQPAELKQLAGQGDAEPPRDVGPALGPVIAGLAGARRVRDPEVLEPGGSG